MIFPVPVVEISPVVEIVIPLAKSDPVTEEKVGSPLALPCNTVVVVPANVPKSPPAVFVTTPLAVRPESVIEVLPVKVEKVPAAAVEAPITVPLIPVCVVLKLAEVIVRSYPLVLIDEAVRPVRDNAPDVPFRLMAPVVRVKPLLAVNV